MNFIEKYKINTKLCDQFIDYHKKNKEYKLNGFIGNETGMYVDEKQKKSTDVYFFNQSKEKFIVEFFSNLSNCLIEYCNKFKISHSLHTHVSNLIQHYNPGDGYYALHYERGGGASIKRELAYMMYCNNVLNGGTEFPFQNKKLNAIKGHLYIWPAFFTHPHKGIISHKKEKYIVTGWVDVV